MTPPSIKCRHCGRFLEAKWQQPIVPGKDGFFWLTCTRRGCALVGQSFTSKSYETVDLTPYYRGKAKA